MLRVSTMVSDVERIITYKLAPINVSVHAMNPELCCKMLHNCFAGEALNKIRRFYEAGIEMNGQIKACKGVNDGAELERSIRELADYLPLHGKSFCGTCGIDKIPGWFVSVGAVYKGGCKRSTEMIHKWQKICYEKHGTHFVQASDEWYLLAEEPFPPEENYDGYSAGKWCGHDSIVGERV